jgi:hypothetical protein
LHFDVTRTLNVFFDQDVIVAERRRRFALARSERIGEFFRLLDQPHAFAAAACNGFDQNGIANLAGALGEKLRRLVFTEIAGCHRHAGFGHQLFGGVLEPHGANGMGFRSDPDEAGLHHGLRELRILRKEAIARMDRLGAGLLSGGDDFFPNQIALARWGSADMHGLVRRAHM